MRYNPYELYRPITKPVKDIIDKEYRKKHTVAQLAKRTKVQIADLRIAFKEGSLYSIREYQQKVRIEKSDKLLEGTDLSIGSIAHKVGYSSASAFSRQFKLYYEMTPSASRKEHREQQARRRRKKA